MDDPVSSLNWKLNMMNKRRKLLAYYCEYTMFSINSVEMGIENVVSKTA
jgi:hypothetical protein